MSRAKTFVFVCACIVFAMFGLSCYLMATVNPAKLTSTMTNISPSGSDTSAKKEKQTSPDALQSDAFVPRYDLKNAEVSNDPLESLVPFYRYVDTYSVIKEVFPPPYPSIELPITKANKSGKYINDLNGAGELKIRTCNITEHTTSSAANESAKSLPAKGLRRSINSYQQKNIDGRSRPIVLKIIDDSGWSRVEIKLSSNKSSIAGMQEKKNDDAYDMPDRRPITEIKLLPNNTVVINSNNMIFNKTKDALNGISKKGNETQHIPILQNVSIYYHYNNSGRHLDSVIQGKSEKFKVDDNATNTINGSLDMKDTAQSSNTVKEVLYSGTKNKTEYFFNTTRPSDNVTAEIKTEIESEARLLASTNNLKVKAHNISNSSLLEIMSMPFRLNDKGRVAKNDSKVGNLDTTLNITVNISDSVKSKPTIKNILSNVTSEVNKPFRLKHNNKSQNISGTFVKALTVLNNVTGAKNDTDIFFIETRIMNNEPTELKSQLQAYNKNQSTTTDFTTESMAIIEESLNISDLQDKERLIVLHNNTEVYSNQNNVSTGIQYQLKPEDETPAIDEHLKAIVSLKTSINKIVTPLENTFIPVVKNTIELSATDALPLLNNVTTSDTINQLRPLDKEIIKVTDLENNSPDIIKEHNISVETILFPEAENKTARLEDAKGLKNITSGSIHWHFVPRDRMTNSATKEFELKEFEALNESMI